MTKIDIISGFLGAGKTTLIKKLLGESFKNEKVVLIENEFGEIGIDGGFLKDSGIEIREMNSGCICCSLVGDFGTSLKEVIEKYQPERIIIEPSGVGKLSDVIKAVADTAGELDVTLNSAVAVVDAVKCKMYMKNFGEFFNNQIEAANAIILSRTGNMNQDKIELAVNLIREHNKDAHIITTPWDQITAESIVKAMEGDDMLEELLKETKEHVHYHEDGSICTCGHDHHHHDHEHEHEHHHHDHDEHCTCGHDHHHDHEHEHEHHHHDHDEHCTCGHDHHHDHHHHHADEVFTSIGIETPKKYTKAELEAILDKLANEDSYGIILRAKGMVSNAENAEGRFLHFDLTPGEFEVRDGIPEYTGRICVIGSKINEEEIRQLFQ
ncbi:MAG: GTP-binding protein [Lachnospiraceae bacterium]|nr:GTP-binding protein [Lachnospiraceae bacterium]